MGKNIKRDNKKCNLYALPIIIVSFISLVVFLSCEDNSAIDRETLVKRHIPTLDASDSLNPFTVGNGEFAFTTDFTGLQSFPEYYEATIPLVTQAQWGWHSFPNLNQYSLDQFMKNMKLTVGK